MKDQVDDLRRRGLRAASMDSTKTREEYLDTVSELKNGTLRLLYCAPERLNNEGFVESIKNVPGGVRMVAVDEAHCISEWGHAFRPDYLKVARFVHEIRAERVVCLTATATRQVAADICDAFDIDESGLFRTPTYRPNLRLQCEVVGSVQEKYPKLFNFLRKEPGPTLIYVTLQKQAEVLADDLKAQGFNVRAFHAGMQTAEKIRLQEEFMRRDDLVICATIAFGMGIDKPNIRKIVHFDLPSSVESYSQQIGRAGRDGRPSTCLIYLCNDDLYLRQNFCYGDLPSKKSVGLLLDEIFSEANAGLNTGDTFIVNHYSQSNDSDIRMTTLQILYAQLELQFGLIRATTPQYSDYQYELINYAVVQRDKTPSAIAINRHARKKAKYHDIDVNAACASTPGLVRTDIIAKLNVWNDNGFIVLKTSGVRHVYRVLQPLPSKPEQKEEIVDKIYAQMQRREQQDLDRVQDFLRLVTTKSCFAKSLASYFGDSGSDVPTKCDYCTFCTSTHPIVLPPRIPPRMDYSRVNAVLKACPARDDPRFLARIAFGITSPRVSKLKLKSHAAFMSMTDQDFMQLVKVFEGECQKSGFESGETPQEGDGGRKSVKSKTRVRG